MRATTLARRTRSRLHGERGFTIVETVVAMVVIFGSLTALAYTATVGFRYIAYGRDRIQATAYANEIMESIRALPYASITNGLDTAEYSSDPNIKSCSGEFRFLTCSGQKLVGQAYAGGYTADWLVPHTGSATTDSGLDITWSTYVTNDDPATNPYGVVVEVAWGGGAISAKDNNLVRVQSDVWSPSGCVSTTTHPFAAPCQPFFYGQAVVPEPEIQIVGQLHDLLVDFEGGALVLPGLEASVQEEQTADLDVVATSSSVWVDDSSGREEDGQVETAWGADSDPASTSGATDGGSATAGPGGNLGRLQSDCCEEIGLQLTVASGDTAVAGLSPAASAADAAACPPSGTRETDASACAGGQTLQGGVASAVAPLDHASASLGPATIVRVGAPSSASTALVDRDASGTTGEDGVVDVRASRTLGTIWIGGFPSAGMSPPSGMSADPTQDANYCLRITGYGDSVRAVAGETTSTSPSAPAPTGTLWYLNAGAFSSIAVTDASLATLAISCSKTQVVDGKNVTWSVSVAAAGMTPATTSTASEVDPSDSTIKLSADATTQPPTLTVTYRLIVNSVDEAYLTVTLNLGSLTASAVYGPPPEFGV